MSTGRSPREWYPFTRLTGVSHGSPSILMEHPVTIPEPEKTASGANVYFEDLALQPMSLLLSFQRTDRVNVDAK